LAHCRKQGHQSMLPNGCAYRGDDGDKCAVGCLIPDHLYDARFEGAGIYRACMTASNTAPADLARLAKTVSDKSFKLAYVIQQLGLASHRELLTDLQQAHDKHLCNSMQDFEVYMECIAINYHLEYKHAMHQ
jgi:hypothetical protein